MSELHTIAEKFNTLFIACKDKETFVLPSFDNSNDIDALLTLNHIIKIAARYRKDPSNIINSINLETLQNIIAIKCVEFCKTPLENKPSIFGRPQSFTGSQGYHGNTPTYHQPYIEGSTVEKFKASFYSVINGIVENFVAKT